VFKPAGVAPARSGAPPKDSPNLNWADRRKDGRRWTCGLRPRPTEDSAQSQMLLDVEVLGPHGPLQT
jgi:hypothetical protein